jgi:pimeloyl-ACP methyl ester carboxylesterase
MPVLAIGAEHATKDAPLQTMQGRATNLRAMIADSGHFVMEENPDDFLAHLLPFLDQH